MQKEFAAAWKPYLNDTNFSSEDATCYESRISFPTPVKLLWDCCNKTYLSYNAIKKQLKQRTSRCNYEDRKKEFLVYQKTEKKIKKAEKKFIKKLFIHNNQYLLRDIKYSLR
jgi:transposase, IS5 family